MNITHSRSKAEGWYARNACRTIGTWAWQLAKAAQRRLGKPASVALVVADVWGLGLIVGGFTIPMYPTMSESSSGQVTHGTDTLVGAEGLGAAVVLAVPLVVMVLVGCALLLRPRRGALPVAWTLTGLVSVFTLLTLASVGLLIIPVTASLVVACATSRSQPEQLGHALGTSTPH